ncbi:hypothetical protein B0H13DRAFT_2358483 [Mycena leptocephala]|nr:hypothetical protein B0H13DRAFT_2358483 [Mycena leptocephala]
MADVSVGAVGGPSAMEWPELFEQIALQLGCPVDVARLALVCRRYNSLASHILYRNILLRGTEMAALALAFRQKPELAGECRSFKLLLIHDADNLNEDLGVILGALAPYAHLRIFHIFIMPWPQDGWPRFTADVWKAVQAVLRSVKEFEIHVNTENMPIWDSATWAPLDELWKAKLVINSTEEQGARREPIDALLRNMPSLRELELYYLGGGRQQQLPTASNHPQLRSFCLNDVRADEAVEESDFLLRHPSLEVVSLKTSVPLQCPEPPEAKSRPLRAVLVHAHVLQSSPAIVNYAIENLVLTLKDVADATRRDCCVSAVRALAGTLRCLELRLSHPGGTVGDAFDAAIVAFLGAAPNLEEFAVIESTIGEGRLRRRFLRDLLVSVMLPALEPSTGLRALRLSSDFDFVTDKGLDNDDEWESEMPRHWAKDVLLPAQLDDLGPVPRAMKCIAWEVYPARGIVYQVDRDGAKNHLSVLATRELAEKWAERSVNAAKGRVKGAGYPPAYPDSVRLRNGLKLTLRHTVTVDVDKFSFFLLYHRPDRFYGGNTIITQRTTRRSNPHLFFCTYFQSCDRLFPLNRELWLCSNGSAPSRAWFIARIKHYFPHDVARQSLPAGNRPMDFRRFSDLLPEEPVLLQAMLFGRPAHQPSATTHP